MAFSFTYLFPVYFLYLSFAHKQHTMLLRWIPRKGICVLCLAPPPCLQRPLKLLFLHQNVCACDCCVIMCMHLSVWVVVSLSAYLSVWKQFWLHCHDVDNHMLLWDKVCHRFCCLSWLHINNATSSMSSFRSGDKMHTPTIRINYAFSYTTKKNPVYWLALFLNHLCLHFPYT